MKLVTEETTTETAFGRKLETPVKYSFSWKIFEGFEEVRENRMELSNDEQVKVRNAEAKAKARQEALVQALKDNGIEKPTIENDPLTRLQNMAKILVASGQSEAEAKQNASALLKMEWPA